MRTIWKFPCPVACEFMLRLPAGAEVLSVQTQSGPAGLREPVFLWALVDPEAPPESRHFRVFGTGKPFDEPGRPQFLGTVQQMDGRLVWHVFEVSR